MSLHGLLYAIALVTWLFGFTYCILLFALGVCVEIYCVLCFFLFFLLLITLLFLFPHLFLVSLVAYSFNLSTDIMMVMLHCFMLACLLFEYS